MKFDPDNNIGKLCATGMALEGEGKKEEALKIFQQAWNEATNDFEKFITAHYVAQHQKTVTDKLKWDKTALHFALKTDNEMMKASYPSLYLNIAKCYEDLKDFDSAAKHYQLALSYTNFLADDGYGNMIKSGIKNGIEKVSSFHPGSSHSSFLEF
jgi:tetratricopeptide (TPR) repeat protein